jgi:hypothetical protein
MITLGAFCFYYFYYFYFSRNVTDRLARVGPETSLTRLLNELGMSYLHISVAGSRVAAVSSPLRGGGAGGDSNTPSTFFSYCIKVPEGQECLHVYRQIALDLCPLQN